MLKAHEPGLKDFSYLKKQMKRAYFCYGRADTNINIFMTLKSVI